MAVTGYWFAEGPVNLGNARADLDADTIKLMLTSSSYSVNRATHNFKDDVTNEVANSGTYSAGGATLASVTYAYVAANSWATSRANSTAYVAGQVVRPATGNGFLYQCITAGTSGGSIPTYPTTYGGTVTDGSVVWECVAAGGVVFDANDVSFTSATITARYAVIYKDTGTASTSPLIAYLDFGSDQTSTAGTFSVTFDATGICYFLMP